MKRIFTQANFSLQTIETWDPSTTGCIVRFNSQIVSRCPLFRESLFEKEPLVVGFGCWWISRSMGHEELFRYNSGHVSRRQRSCCLLGKLLATLRSPKLSLSVCLALSLSTVTASMSWTRGTPIAINGNSHVFDPAKSVVIHPSMYTW